MKPAKYIIILVIFLSADSLFSQIKLGAKYGVSLGNLSDNSTNIYSRNFESSVGQDYGIFSELIISQHTAIRLEVLSTRKGGRRDGIQPIPVSRLIESGQDLNTLNQIAIFSGGSTITDETPLFANFSNKSELNYIEIPLLFKYNFWKEKQLYIEAGPYIGFLLSADQITLGSSTFFADEQGNLPLQIPNPFDPSTPFGFPEQQFNATTDVIDNLERTNYGIHFGLGYTQIYNNKHDISFGVRATYGFAPIQENELFGTNRIGSVTFNFSYARIFSKKEAN